MKSHDQNMDARPECFVCGKIKKTLFNAHEGQVSFKHDIPGLLADILGVDIGTSYCKICYKCLQNLENVAEMKRQLLKSPTASKLCVYFPARKPKKSSNCLIKPDPLPTFFPSQKRGFVETIIQSVKKLKTSSVNVTSECKEKSPKRIKMDHTYSTNGTKSLSSTKNKANKPNNSESMNESIQTKTKSVSLNGAKQTKSEIKKESIQTKSNYTLFNEAKQTKNEHKQSFILLQEVSLNALAQKGNSVLFEKGYIGVNVNEEDEFFMSVLHEMETKSPFLFDLLDNICGNNGNKTYTMCTIYSMIMHSRNHQASAVPKFYAACAIRANVENKFFQLLNKINITVSPLGKKALKKEMLEVIGPKIDKSISSVINKANTDTVSQTGENLTASTISTDSGTQTDESISATINNTHTANIPKSAGPMDLTSKIPVGPV